MPTTTRPLWILTAAIILGYPITAERYFTAMSVDGAYPPHGDTIMIPIFGSIVVATIASPFLLGICWLCLRRYDPRTKLFAWRSDRPIRTLSASLVASVLAIGCLFLAADAIVTVRVWEEYLWTVYFLTFTYWILVMRAALVNASTYEEFHFS